MIIDKISKDKMAVLQMPKDTSMKNLTSCNLKVELYYLIDYSLTENKRYCTILLDTWNFVLFGESLRKLVGTAHTVFNGDTTDWHERTHVQCSESRVFT